MTYQVVRAGGKGEGGEHPKLCVFAVILISALTPPPARARAPRQAVRLEKNILTDKNCVNITILIVVILDIKILRLNNLVKAVVVGAQLHHLHLLVL